MKVFLTGVTGFVGRFVLYEILQRSSNLEISVLLRGKKGRSAKDRWDQEVLRDTLYAQDIEKLKKVQIIEGDLDKLTEVSWSDTSAPNIILHCAANVKTLDTYANLYRDNVMGVQSLCDAAVSWGVARILLVSTCYIHPRGTIGKSELLPKNLPKELFTTDYTYTKYLGEHIAHSYTDKLQISLLRLSCVGAPVGWLDSHPTPNAMAHLGIVSLLLRKRITMMRVPSTSQLSTIPVDIVATQITNELMADTKDPWRVLQFCASPNDRNWNISLHRLYETVQRLAPNLNLQMWDCSQEEFLSKVKSNLGISYWTPWGYKSYIFHKEINDFVSKFADGQRFETSIPDTEFPSVTQEHVYEQTCLYVARGIHQFKLEKGIQASLLDHFWGSMTPHMIQAKVVFTEESNLGTKEETERKLYNFLATHRRMFATPARLLTFKPESAIDIDWTTDDTFGTENPELHNCSIKLIGEPEKVKGFHINIHHGLGDGLSYMPLFPRLSDMRTPVPIQSIPKPTGKPKSLSYSQEFMCFLFYFAFLIKLIFKDSEFKNELSTRKHDIASTPIKKNKDTTYTATLLQNAYPSIRAALKKEELVYCVTASLESPAQRGLNLPTNSFVPILLPWDSGSNTMAQLCLRSKVVKIMCYCITAVVASLDLLVVRDYLVSRIDCVISTVFGSDSTFPNLSAFYFDSPTPSVVPFTITSMTLGNTAHMCFSSSHPSVSAAKLKRDILSIE